MTARDAQPGRPHLELVDADTDGAPPAMASTADGPTTRTVVALANALTGTGDPYTVARNIRRHLTDAEADDLADAAVWLHLLTHALAP